MKSYAGIATLALAAGASAQTNATFILTTSNPISPTMPTTTVRVYAAWDQPGLPTGTPPFPPNGEAFVFSGGDYDLVASGPGDFTSASAILNPAVSLPGIPIGSRANGASIGQVHIPTIGIVGDPSNPILLAEYTWTTTDFTPRTVVLSTENTTRYLVTDWGGGATMNLFLMGEFTPGFGIIPFIPAAPTLALLGACALLTARRHRQPGETA